MLCINAASTSVSTHTCMYCKIRYESSGIEVRIDTCLMNVVLGCIYMKIFVWTAACESLLYITTGNWDEFDDVSICTTSASSFETLRDLEPYRPKKVASSVFLQPVIMKRAIVSRYWILILALKI